MAFVKLGPLSLEISAIMRDVIDSPTDVAESDVALLSSDLQSDLLSIKSLEIIYLWNKSNKKKPLLNLLQGCSLIFPEHKPALLQVSSELLERRKYLKMKYEEKQYNKMVHGSTSNPDVVDVLTVGNQITSFKNQAAIGVNMIVAIFATFGIAYYIGTQLKYEKPVCLVFGLIGAILIMMVEMFLFIFRSIQMEHAYERPVSLEQLAAAKQRTGSLNPNPTKMTTHIGVDDRPLVHKKTD